MEDDVSILPGVDEYEFDNSLIVLAQTKDGVRKKMTADEFLESDALFLKVVRRGKTGDFKKLMEAAVKRLVSQYQN